MSFAESIYFYLAVAIVPLLGLFLYWSGKRRHNLVNRLGNPDLIARLSANVNWRGRRWQAGLWLATAALLLFVLARPQWGEEVRTVEREGVQVMVALDISESMLAEDIKPNRLSRAKLEIADLMTRLGGDEVGLVLFSGASFIQFPLTSDYATARSFLDDARPNVISKPGTNIGDAVRTAMSGFDENSAAQRVIVLITDGEAHDAEALATVEQAAEEGVIFYTIGFGSLEGVPIPDTDVYGNVVGFKQNRAGEVVLSRLDETTLREIAQIGNGHYYHASAGGSELDALVDELNRMQKGEMGTQMEVQKIERFQIFLALALALATLAYLIPERLAGSTGSRTQRLTSRLAPSLGLFR